MLEPREFWDSVKLDGLIRHYDQDAERAPAQALGQPSGDEVMHQRKEISSRIEERE